MLVVVLVLTGFKTSIKNPSLSLDPAPFAMQHSPPEASSSFCSAQTSRQGPLRPTLGANPFPEVTDPVVCGWHSMVLVPVMVLKVCAAGHGCHGAAAPSAAAHDPRLQGKTPASRMPSNPLGCHLFLLESSFATYFKKAPPRVTSQMTTYCWAGGMHIGEMPRTHGISPDKGGRDASDGV